MKVVFLRDEIEIDSYGLSDQCSSSPDIEEGKYVVALPEGGEPVTTFAPLRYHETIVRLVQDLLDGPKIEDYVAATGGGGGGFYKLNKRSSRITLYGRSSQYGQESLTLREQLAVILQSQGYTVQVEYTE